MAQLKKLWSWLCGNKTFYFFVRNWKFMKDAFWQLIVVWGLSNIPLFLLIAFSIYRVNGADVIHVLTKVVIDVFTPSTVVFYVAALMAPLIWVFIDCFEKRKWVPLFKSFSTAIAGIMIVLTAILFLDATHDLKNKSLADATFIVFYVAAIIIWYFSIFYSKVLENAIPSLTTDSPNDILAELNDEANDA